MRFDTRRVKMGRALCPPYDVISEELGRKLRGYYANAIHLELPRGEGPARYRNAALAWRRWIEKGVLVRDPEPGFYVVEQVFRLDGKKFRRVGLLAALGLDRGSAARVLPHEKTLSKPKKDRTRLLKAIKVNTSPIFGIYTDPAGSIRGLLSAIRRTRPAARGVDSSGVAHRLWRVHEPADVRRLERAFGSKKILIADGHHRYEVARGHWERTRAPGADAILAYLCAEEDPGLIVLPTHRVLRLTPATKRLLRDLARAKRVSGLTQLERSLRRERSPYAFGLCNGRFQILKPAPGDRGVRSRFPTAWLAERILSSVDAHDIRYFHDARAAAAAARRSGQTALLVKPFSVSDIRAAVERAGLLPQKSTYFFPKISTGLVFRPLD